ncbi:MAG: hypothetical protein PHN82_10390 [bacterium]|nr:hypothetical protein [bacterium]
MAGKVIAIVAACAAAAAFAGCRKVYMVPTPQGWMEMESRKGGDELKFRPAEKVEMQVR